MRRWKMVEGLILDLGSANSEVRYEAASELCEAACDEKDVSAAVPALVGALGDGDAWVREMAAETLGKIGNASAVPALVKALWDKDLRVRMIAVNALVKIGPPAVPALIRALGDENEDVRMGAAEALVKIGPPAVPALIRALGDESDYVRASATEALVKIGPRNYRDLDLVVSIGGKLKKEGKDFSYIMELHSKWVGIMNQRASAIINDKSFHVPKVITPGRETDGAERVLRLKRAV